MIVRRAVAAFALFALLAQQADAAAGRVITLTRQAAATGEQRSVTLAFVKRT